MSRQRQVEEVVTRCVSCMVFYRYSLENAHARAAMNAELQSLADQVGELRLGAGGTTNQVTKAVKAELNQRCGPEAGERLAAEFVRAFAACPPSKRWQGHVPHRGDGVRDPGRS